MDEWMQHLRTSRSPELVHHFSAIRHSCPWPSTRPQGVTNAGTKNDVTVPPGAAAPGVENQLYIANLPTLCVQVLLVCKTRIVEAGRSTRNTMSSFRSVRYKVCYGAQERKTTTTAGSCCCARVRRVSRFFLHFSLCKGFVGFVLVDWVLTVMFMLI